MLSSRTSRAPRKGRWMLQIAGFHGSCCRANCGLVPPCQVPCGSRSDALFLFLPEEDPAPSTQTFSSVYSSHLSRGLGGPCPRRAPCRLGLPGSQLMQNCSILNLVVWNQPLHTCPWPRPDFNLGQCLNPVTDQPDDAGDESCGSALHGALSPFKDNSAVPAPSTGWVWGRRQMALRHPCLLFLRRVLSSQHPLTQTPGAHERGHCSLCPAMGTQHMEQNPHEPDMAGMGAPPQSPHPISPSPLTSSSRGA